MSLNLMKKTIGWLVCFMALLPALNMPAVGQEVRGPTLERVTNSGMFFVGHRESAVPFSYVNGNGQEYDVLGYSWEICQHVVKAVSERAGKEIKVIPVAMTANSRFLMIKTGMAQIECGASTNSVARQKLVGFSKTIYVAEVKVLVRKADGIARLADLNGRRIVTVVGTTADRLVKGAALKHGITINYAAASTHGEALQMMLRGEADAYAGDDAILAATRAAVEGKGDLVFLGEVLSQEPYGLVLPKDDVPFKKLVDDVIVSLIERGELQRIYERWFMSPIPPKGINLEMPMSQQMKAALANPNDLPTN